MVIFIIYELVSEQSERDTYRLTQLTIGDVCLFIYICLDIHMSFCTLTLSYFCVSWMFNPVPNFTKQNPMVIDHYPYHWRASGASETLSGVTQLKIGDICLFMCVDVHMSFCTLTLVYFCVNSVCDPVPNFTKQFLLIYRSLPVSP